MISRIRSDEEFAPREFDEKFQILTAPGLRMKDLAYYRSQCCELRARPVTVGYLDIDDFKAFNDRLTETRVDRELLPKFMRVIEAMVFGQGQAYRIGGDEYFVILPNKDQVASVDFFTKLQIAIGSADYSDIGDVPTISIGVCEVTIDTFLTDQLIEDRAVAAKHFAKAQGKNCVAGYAPPTSDQLAVV